jgi:hypothetical protein
MPIKAAGESWEHLLGLSLSLSHLIHHILLSLSAFPMFAAIRSG